MTTQRRKGSRKPDHVPTGAQLEVEADRGKLCTGVLDKPATDFGFVFEKFGLDPNKYRIAGDTVRMSTWEQSRRTEGGEFETVQLFSYRAQFVAVTPETVEADDDLADAAKWVRTRPARKQPKRKPRKDSTPVTYVHLQGDEQAGKSEGGGLKGLAEREYAAIDATVNYLKQLLKLGHNVTQIADLSAGDRVENIFGHYNSQARTTDTLRDQLKFARDLDLARTKALLQFGLPLVKVYTPSNHGEMRQAVGQSPYTSESDNLDLIIAEMVLDVADAAGLDGIVWHIPHDEYITRFTLNGVGCGLTHGHKVRGRVDQWWLKQRDSAVFHDDFRIRVGFAGHRHHFYAEDIGGTTIIQTPSLDGGSPWFQASTGARAHSGAVGLLVGEGLKTGWGSLQVL